MVSSGRPVSFFTLSRCYLRHWFYGALTAVHALDGEVWELKNLNRIYYLENEDGTQRITPNVLDCFR